MSGGVSVEEITNNDGAGATLCLPGILARVNEQFMPIQGLLPGRVVGLQDTLYYSHKDMIREAIHQLEDFKRSNLPVTIMGASMGGMKIPFIIEAWRERYPGDSLNWLRQVIIVDAPTGAETMKGLPTWAASLLASNFVGDILASPLGDWIVGKMTEPPKDDEITLPPERVRMEIAGRPVPKTEWNGVVQTIARAGLTGYSGELWWTWVSWMVRVGRDGWLAKACNSLEGLDVTYLACVHKGNGVVAQPEAADWWRAHAPGLKVAEVNGTHCGFLQNQPEFEAAFREILV